MAQAGTLTYSTKLDTTDLESGIKNCQSLSVALGNVMSDVFNKVKDVITDTIKTGVTYNAQIEQYTTALTTLLGSTEEASSTIEQIKKDAAETPFDVAGLTQANQLLISTGLSADESRETILALGNAVSATGGGNDELSRMATNLQQIKNTGQATALDIKQFAYAGIDIYGLLSDYTGKTKEEVAEMTVTWDDLNGALVSASQEGGKYFGAMEAQSKTFNGQVSTLKDNASQLLGTLTEGLTSKLSGTVLPFINDFMGEVVNIVGEEGITGLINYLIESVENSIPEVMNKGFELIGNLADGITANFPTIWQTGIDIITEIIQGLIDGLPTLVEKVPEMMITILNTITNPDNLSKILQLALDLITALVEGFFEELPVLLEEIPVLITNVIDFITNPDNTQKFWDCVTRIFNAIVKAVKNTDWLGIGKNILEGILNGLSRFPSMIWNAVTGLGNSIMSSVKSFFGIQSPSKLMRDVVGKNLDLGIAVGLDENADEVLGTIDSLTDDIYKEMNKAVSLTTGQINATAQANSTYTASANITLDSNTNPIYLDGKKVGQQITPYISKTYSLGGI